MLAMLDKTVAAVAKAPIRRRRSFRRSTSSTVVAQGAPGADGMYGAGARTRRLIEQGVRVGEEPQGVCSSSTSRRAQHAAGRSCRACSSISSAPTCTSASIPSSTCTTSAKGVRPSAKVGQMMASDVNYAIQTLDKLVAEKQSAAEDPRRAPLHAQTMVPDAREHQARRRACRS